MYTPDLSQTLVIAITALLAYFPTVAVSGCFQAWLADKLGDPTPKEMGYLTMDPFVHTNLLGLLWFMAYRLLGSFGIAFGNRLPLNPHRLGEPHRDAKVIALYMGDVASNGVLLILGALFAALYELYYIAQCSMPGHTGVILQLFITSFVWLNLIFLIINTVIGMLECTIFFLFANKPEYESYRLWAYIIGILLMGFLVSPFLGAIFAHIVDYIQMQFFHFFKWSCGV